MNAYKIKKLVYINNYDMETNMRNITKQLKHDINEIEKSIAYLEPVWVPDKGFRRLLEDDRIIFF